MVIAVGRHHGEIHQHSARRLHIPGEEHQPQHPSHGGGGLAAHPHSRPLVGHTVGPTGLYVAFRGDAIRAVAQLQRPAREEIF